MTNFINRRRFLVFFGALLVIGLPFYTLADSNAQHNFAVTNIGADASAYDTELFNLLRNRKNIIDNKNYFQMDFSNKFDALLIQATSAQTKSAASELRKRLLSGPAAKARAIKDVAAQKIYFFYDACQAHDCGDTNLGLIFEPQTKRMFAKLTIRGGVEFLGTQSVEEKNLLNYMQSAQSR